MLQNQYVDLLPFRQENPYSIINMFSLNGTGVGGRFVVLETGNQDPNLSAGDWSESTPGYDYEGVTNVRYENPRKVRYAASGAFKGAVLGLLLNGTAEYDENGNKLLFNKQVQTEKQVVVSGMAVPIATEGTYRLTANAYSGAPLIGQVGYISNGGEGKLQFAAASAALDPYAVCKVVSATGNMGGVGYVDVKLTLN